MPEARRAIGWMADHAQITPQTVCPFRRLPPKANPLYLRMALIQSVRRDGKVRDALLEGIRTSAAKTRYRNLLCFSGP